MMDLYDLVSNWTEAQLTVARQVRAFIDAEGILNECHVGRRMVDLEAVITYEGTEHIHSLVLGQELAGIKASS
jgi:glutaryl-CoA dehydrogenase